MLSSYLLLNLREWSHNFRDAVLIRLGVMSHVVAVHPQSFLLAELVSLLKLHTQKMVDKNPTFAQSLIVSSFELCTFPAESRTGRRNSRNFSRPALLPN